MDQQRTASSPYDRRLEDEGKGDHAEVCRDASRAFLRDHLGRWAPRLGGLLVDSAADPIFRTAGQLLHDFVVFDADLIDADGAPVHVVDPTRSDTVPSTA